MTRREKILFLSPTLASGGGERVVSELSLHFSSRIETYIAVFLKKVSYPYHGTLINLDIKTPKNIFKKIYYFFIACKRFKKVTIETKPTAVISLGVIQNIVNAFTQKNAILRVGNSLSKGYKGIRGVLIKILMPIVCRRAKTIIAVSDGIKEDLQRNFNVPGNRIVRIYNPVDVGTIQKRIKEPLSPEHQKIFNQPTLINIGRLCEQKGQEDLLRAFQLIYKKYSTVRLVIIGEGPLKSRIQLLAETLKISPAVFLFGWQENPFKFLARSKIFIFSSLWEGFGNAIVEAMACAVPVISFDCHTGPREIISGKFQRTPPTKTVVEQEQYGILVPVGNTKLLAEAMQLLLADKNLSLHYQKQSVSRAHDFDSTKITAQYEQLLLTSD